MVVGISSSEVPASRNPSRRSGLRHAPHECRRAHRAARHGDRVRHLAWAAESRALRAGARQPGVDALADALALELGERRQDV